MEAIGRRQLSSVVVEDHANSRDPRDRLPAVPRDRFHLKLQAALAEHLQRTRQSPREWATTEMYGRVIPLKNQQIAEQGIPTRRQE